MKTSGRIVSVFGVNPSRIGGGEVFARALSQRLAERNWESVLCYQSLPEGDVRRFLELPNVTFDVLKDAWKFAARSTRASPPLSQPRSTTSARARVDLSADGVLDHPCPNTRA